MGGAGIRGASMRMVAVASLAGLLSAQIIALPAPAFAYIPGLQEIYAAIAKRGPAISRVMFETRSYVFDPIGTIQPAPAGARHADVPGPVIPARTFRQKVYWIRDTFLGIETYSESGTLLHFYWFEGLTPIQDNLDPERPFTEADILPPYLPFITGSAAQWRDALTYWGISPSTVDLIAGHKGGLYYRLLEGEGRSLWIDQAHLRPVRLETRIAGADQPQSLAIEFREFLLIGKGTDENIVSFPRTVDYLLNGRLFKQTVLLSFRVNPSVQRFPISRLRKRAREAQPAAPVSLGRSR